MTTTTGDQLVADYLARLDAAALRLPPDRRSELLEGIAEHIASARAAGELHDEAAVRTLLDRLGEPEEIVAAAGEGISGGGWGPPPWSAGPQLVPTRPGTGLEVAAVVMLTAGSLLPVIGWLVGVVLLWTSRRWRASEKLLGTLVVPGGPGILLPLAFLAPASQSCTTSSSGTLEAPAPGAPPEMAVPTPMVIETTCEGASAAPGWVVVPLLVLALVAPIVVAVFLLRRARARADAEPPVLRPVGPGTWTGLEIAAVLVLAVGSFVVPFVGSLVGLVLVWSSPRWTGREKAIATALTVSLPVVLGLMFVLPLVAPAAALGLIPALILAAFGPALAAGYLALALSRRPVPLR